MRKGYRISPRPANDCTGSSPENACAKLLARAEGRGASRAPEDALGLRPRGLACLAWALLISKASEAQRLWCGLALSAGVGAREEALPSPALPLASRHHVASLAAAFQSMCWRGALTKDCEKDSEEFLSLLGKKIGKLVKGGEAVAGPEGEGPRGGQGEGRRSPPLSSSLSSNPPTPSLEAFVLSY